MTSYLEKIYVEHLANFFTKAGFFVLTNVRLPPREIDLLLLDHKSVKLIAVEVKREKWKDAINQSIKNKLYADYSLLAMPSKNCTRVPLEILHNYGLGMIRMDLSEDTFSASIVELPTQSDEANRFFKRELMNIFESKQNIGDKL